MAQHKPILVLDFDGTMTTYASGWQGIDVCADPPTPGLEAFLEQALAFFTVHVHSSRSGEQVGREAMQGWCARFLRKDVWKPLHFPEHKPPAMLTLDDRAQQFLGHWGDVKVRDLLAFEPWTRHTPPPHEGPRHA